MSSLNESINETSREDIALKSGTRVNNCCSEDCISGLKFINFSFGTLTVIITIALLAQIYYGDYQVTPHGSVATDNLECSKIGTGILKQGGNAVDAAIASAFCLAVTTPYSTGLDAEGQMMIYSHRSRLSSNVVDFSGVNVESPNLPRLVLGLAYIHQQFASMSWKELVKPAAQIARKGFLISKILVQAITQAKTLDLYGRLEAGQLLRLEALSQTLSRIANTSETELYSYLTPNNQPILSQATSISFNNHEIFVPNTPSIGPSLLINLQDLEQYNFTAADTLKPLYFYQLAASTQSIYNHLNLSSKFHRGTSSNVASVDLNDNYVSLVTGMQSLFGSGEMTAEGYVQDVPEKLPQRLPLIITHDKVICGRRFVLGAPDVAVATQLVASLIVGGANASESVEAPRFHMLDNGTIGIEGFYSPLFGEEILRKLESITKRPLLVPEPYDSSNIVEKIKDELSSHSDSRGGGIASRF